jgi:hypothetical protein
MSQKKMVNEVPNYIINKMGALIGQWLMDIQIL